MMPLASSSGPRKSLSSAPSTILLRTDFLLHCSIEGATTIIAACIPGVMALVKNVTSRRGDTNGSPVLLQSIASR